MVGQGGGEVVCWSHTHLERLGSLMINSNCLTPSEDTIRYVASS